MKIVIASTNTGKIREYQEAKQEKWRIGFTKIRLKCKLFCLEKPLKKLVLGEK